MYPTISIFIFLIQQFVTAENRRKVYTYLFQEGCIVIKKDVHGGPFNSDTLPVRNLEVMKLLQSLGSKKWCTVSFNWSYYYYILTDLGVQELRKFLGIGEDVHPNTLSKTVEDINTFMKREPREDRPRFNGGRGEGGDRPRFSGGRGEGGDRPRFSGGRGEGGDRPRFSGGRGRGDSEGYRKRE